MQIDGPETDDALKRAVVRCNKLDCHRTAVYVGTAQSCNYELKRN